MGCLAPFDFISDFYFLMFGPLALLALIGIVGLLRIKLHSSNVSAKADAQPEQVLSKVQMTQFRAAFTAIDIDNSGDVDARELQAALKKDGGTKLSEAEAAELVAEADLDGDGRISFDEFLVAMASKARGWEHIWWRHGVASVINQHVFAALLLSFVVLPAASAKIFRMLTPCLEALPDGTKLHRADLAVNCASDAYYRAVATAIVMIFIYPIGWVGRVCGSFSLAVLIAHTARLGSR